MQKTDPTVLAQVVKKLKRKTHTNFNVNNKNGGTNHNVSNRNYGSVNP